MTKFGPEKFEDKYANYFPEFQHVYKDAFGTVDDGFDSSLIHGVDRQILNESEPLHDDGGFSVQLPDDPAERLTTVEIDGDEFDAVLDRYVDEIGSEFRRVFGIEA